MRQRPLPLQAVKDNLVKYSCDFPADFDINNYRVFQGEPQKILRDGDLLDLGGRQIRVVHTPGHSPGHCCFYEPETSYLFSGDLVYKGCLYAFYPTTDPQLFYDSVKRVRELKIAKILPGHHQLSVPTSMIDEIEAALRRLREAEGSDREAGCLILGRFRFTYERRSCMLT